MIVTIGFSFLTGLILLALAVWMWRQSNTIQQQNARLLYSVVHDELANPLQIVLATLANIKKYTKHSAMPLGNDLNSIHQTTKHLINVTRNLKALTLLDVQGCSYIKQVVDLVGISQRIVVDLSEEAKSKDVQLAFEGCEWSAQIFANEENLIQVIHNLVDNAIKYSRQGDQQSKVVVTIQKTAQRVILIIEDNGQGICSEGLKRLGTKPALRNANTIGSAGSGLGWLFTKTVVKRNQGVVRVHSVENQGTKITIQFPKAARSV